MTISRHFLSRSALCAALLGLVGCASIPAERAGLPQQDMARSALAADIKLASEGWPEAQWWLAYQDESLNALMQQALRDAPTLAVAQARIGAARSALADNKAERDINLGLDAGASRQRYSSNGLFPPPIGGAYYNEEILRLHASYDVDWWGKQRAQIASALGEVNARRADYAMAEQSLAAAVVHHYFLLQGGWARLANLHQREQLQQALIDDKVKRMAHGLATIDELRMTEAQLSVLQEDSAQLTAGGRREREVLRALLGAEGSDLSQLAPHPMSHIAPALPAKLGLELLARRADLQAARWRVTAALSRIEASEAMFYPDLNLSAAFGLDVLSLSQLFDSASRTVLVGPTLSLPLFDSTRLKARLGAARQEHQRMIADYNLAVFNVVRDVAQAGIELQGINQQMSHQRRTAQVSADLLSTAQARYRQGLSDQAGVLQAQIALLQQRDSSLQLQTEQRNADVALIAALGGGYRSAPQTTPTTDPTP